MTYFEKQKSPLVDLDVSQCIPTLVAYEATICWKEWTRLTETSPLWGNAEVQEGGEVHRTVRPGQLFPCWVRDLASPWQTWSGHEGKPEENIENIPTKFQGKIWQNKKGKTNSSFFSGFFLFTIYSKDEQERLITRYHTMQLLLRAASVHITDSTPLRKQHSKRPPARSFGSHGESQWAANYEST